MQDMEDTMPAMTLDPVGVVRSPIIDIKPYSKNYLQVENLRMPAWMEQIHRDMEAE
ncbi:MAG TPA: hypothetical protein VLT88_03345 [Desulfosarcina sp.]|nr:hypothetical protein [Desulfosarcina sp.]